MRKTLFHFSTAKVLLLLISFSCVLSACENDLSKLPKPDDAIDYTKDVAEGVQLIISQQGLVKTEITAPKLVKNDLAKPPYTEMPQGLHAQFFNNKGVVSTTLSARYARYFVNSKNILLQDSVVVENTDGSKLFAEELIWNNGLEKFYSEKEVFILKDGNMAYGDGLEANKELTEVKILRQRGIIPVAKGTLSGQ